MGAVLFLISKQPENVDISDEIHEKQRYIFDVIANNEDMRNQIINGNLNSVNSFARTNIPNSLDFKINVCNVEDICNEGTPNDRDIYVSETIISSSLTNYPGTSKKLRFFVWAK